jgi:hypothetical protein
MTDKERYATIGTWVEVFREEGVNISETTIRDRLRKANIVGKTARSKIGRVLQYGFYSESDIRGLLMELLQDLPQTGENGTFEKDGEIYGAIRTLAKLIGLSERAVQLRIQGSHISLTEGRCRSGWVCNFYTLSEVRNLCADLLQPLPQANEDGTFKNDGQTYITIEGASRVLGISTPTIRSRLSKNPLKSIRGKDSMSRIFDFYSLSELRNLCADLLEDLPQAGKGGTFEKDGHIYGPRRILAKLLGVWPNAIRNRLHRNPLRSIRGKDPGGRVFDFYSVSEVRKLCADLIAKKSKK